MENSSELKIGYKMPDGTVYAGISQITGTAMYTMPEDCGYDESTLLDVAVSLIRMEERYGYKSSQQMLCKDVQDATKDDAGWRLPDGLEMAQIWENKKDIGGLNGNTYWTNYGRPHTFRVEKEDKEFFGGPYSSDQYKAQTRLVRTESRKQPN